jgi:hypothetical protein
VDFRILGPLELGDQLWGPGPASQRAGDVYRISLELEEIMRHVNVALVRMVGR